MSTAHFQHLNIVALKARDDIGSKSDRWRRIPVLYEPFEEISDIFLESRAIQALQASGYDDLNPKMPIIGTAQLFIYCYFHVIDEYFGDEIIGRVNSNNLVKVADPHNIQKRDFGFKFMSPENNERVLEIALRVTQAVVQNRTANFNLLNDRGEPTGEYIEEPGPKPRSRSS